MASSSLSSVLAVTVVLVLASHARSASHHAPAPAVDCSSLIVNMAECLSYVSNGSAVAKPEGNCCGGLKTVLKADPNCLCFAFNNSAQLGVVLNVTKAASLPAACKLSAPSAATCGLSITPSGAPALSPSGQSSPTSSPAPSTGGSTGAAAELSFFVWSMVVGLVFATFSCF